MPVRPVRSLRFLNVSALLLCLAVGASSCGDDAGSLIPATGVSTTGSTQVAQQSTTTSEISPTTTTSPPPTQAETTMATTTTTTQPVQESACPQIPPGPQDYMVTTEELCGKGAPDDGIWHVEVVCTDDQFILTNIEFEWTKEYDLTASGDYLSVSPGLDDDDEWFVYVTLTTDGFITYSEHTDADLGWVEEPCFRYTYSLITD